MLTTASTIIVHELIGIFVHVSAVLQWPTGSVRLTTKEVCDE